MFWHAAQRSEVAAAGHAAVDPAVRVDEAPTLAERDQTLQQRGPFKGQPGGCSLRGHGRHSSKYNRPWTNKWSRDERIRGSTLVPRAQTQSTSSYAYGSGAPSPPYLHRASTCPGSLWL